MKKLIAVLLLIVTLVPMGTALADYYIYTERGEWWHVDDYGNLTRVHTKPMSWDTSLANRNFPSWAIHDTTAARKAYNGRLVGELAVTSNRGSNLRSYPTIEGSYYYYQGTFVFNHPTVIRKLHSNVTVFVNFSTYDSEGREWYHVTCTDGTDGFVAASRMRLLGAW
ncbi:MAG: hypothetical protein IKS31_03135 [Clostridia bacterium]|nr:hypothetical protein [Clostridia bacterium]MBR4457934.1 hypothetical protein [Clostridia bacterium]